MLQKPLSISQERAFLKKAKQGDQKARKRLFLAYNGLIVKTAFRHISTKRQTIRMLEIANIAFLKAIDTYQPTPRARFWPYALRCINEAMKKTKHKKKGTF